MNRRDFLKLSSVSLAGAFLMGLFGRRKAWSAGPVPDLVEVTGGTPRERVAAAFKALGGIKKFVPTGSTVVVKPNIAWARNPEQGADTGPQIVAEVVTACRQAGAKRVVVMDHTCDKAQLTYPQSGIEAAARAAGAEVLHADQKDAYREVAIPKGKALTSALVLKEVLDCDVLINLPVVKVHGSSRVTLGMKNWMGVVWDRGALHRSDLHQAIVDISTVVKPRLVLLDATRILTSRGPKGPGDLTVLNQLVAGTDPVAADAYGARILGFNPQEIGHIRLAGEAGLGKSNLDALKVQKIKLG
ncbi:MAG: hypothetical protein BWY73_01435 [candidate division TA06 bacterium ADurb.Bin417]|uniref:DUF362 domain-containing protein n=1 Tax=candidate division TA06 bacterium ADurb.Bin417 TaxID=1852828 RepID=A0A1V5M9I6_UNCT6|nr:MAG: hypothetical protein BWY73_01435 [candidate division TA06 bacterium ADurb.Bin417]